MILLQPNIDVSSIHLCTNKSVFKLRVFRLSRLSKGNLSQDNLSQDKSNSEPLEIENQEKVTLPANSWFFIPR